MLQNKQILKLIKMKKEIDDIQSKLQVVKSLEIKIKDFLENNKNKKIRKSSA